MSRPRPLRSAALLSLPLLLTVAALAPASAAQHHRRPGWNRPRISLRTVPRRVLSAAHGHGRVRITSIRDVGGHPRVSVTTRRTPAAARAAVATAQQAPGAVAVSVDSRVHTAVIEANDTDRPVQWALDQLGAESLWSQQPGDGVVVAVVDTGVDAAHPDLDGVVLPGTDLVTPGGDGSGDGNGHGTHVAGIIAALANNHLGVAGLAQGVRILPVRVLDDTGAGWSSNIAKGIIWATDHGASVVNLSLGGPDFDAVTASAVQYAEDHNVVVVAAAGNDRANGDPTTYPAAYPGVLGVAASDAQSQIASFSETGGDVDLAAPGVQIASTYPPDRYVYMSGTSMATPYVSASAALLEAADPGLSPQQAAQELESTAVDLGPAGRDDVSGYGLVDPAAALCSLAECAAGTPAAAAPADTSAPSPSTDSPPVDAPTALVPTTVPRLRLRVARHRIAAILHPADRQLLVLQRRRGHRWVRVERRRVNARGRAVFARLHRGRYRVRLRPTPGSAGATSRVRRLR
jgi:type VII secretion-associated serine protease mycosin